MAATQSDETQDAGAKGRRWGTSAQSGPSGGGTPARSFEAARLGEEVVPRDGRAQAEGPKGRHAAPGPQVPWPAESMFRRRPDRSWRRSRGRGRSGNRAGRNRCRSQLTHQPAESPQAPRHYVINSATTHFRFDARSAPPSRPHERYPMRECFVQVTIHQLQADWLRLRTKPEREAGPPARSTGRTVLRCTG